jgi:adenylate cyclase class IV
MGRNVEIKARIADLDAMRARVRSLSAAPGALLNQTDTFFVVPNGRLKLREFADGSGELIFYDRRNRRGPKLSIYTRVACPQVSELRELFRRLLPVRGTVANRREVFLVGQTRIHLDRVERLGSFLELEVVLSSGETCADGERMARRLLRTLRVPAGDLVAAAYIDLLEAFDRP